MKKTSTIKKMIVVACVLFLHLLANAQAPTCNLTAKNVQYPTSSDLQFDIYLLHTNYPAASYKYAAGQYFFDLNNAVFNGATSASITTTITASGLPSTLRPVNPTVYLGSSGTQLRMAGNLFGTNTFSVSHTGDGTLVARVKIHITGTTFDQSKPLNLAWRQYLTTLPYTSLYYWDSDGKNKSVTPVYAIISNKSTSATDIDETVASKTDAITNSLSVFPNPVNATSSLNFNIELQGESIQAVRVIDIYGKVITEKPANQILSNQIELGEKFAAGVYQLQVQTTAGNCTRTFIVE
jgi:hypothetical protein